MGVYQHHDAVSGTAKQHVADNYHDHLVNAIVQNVEQYVKIVTAPLSKNAKIVHP
jgi:hypothetical protein